MTTVTKELKEQIEATAEVWYESNKEKNSATTSERKAKEKLELLTKDLEEPYVYRINNEYQVVAGVITDNEGVEIDPRKFYELYPEEFWEVVKITMDAAKMAVGEKGASKACVPKTVTKFNVKKEKIKG